MRSLTAACHKMTAFSRLSGSTLCRKRLSTTQNLSTNKQTGFGICIDIDGVILRGKAPIPSAVLAMKKLTDTSGNFKYPVVFLTNSSIPEQEKAMEISELFNIKATPEQFVMASSPLRLFKSFHDKKCLFLGQDDLHKMAKKLGFSNVCTIEEVMDAFPLLDATSHKKRSFITEMSFKLPSSANLSWTPVEAIILFTSPLQWETVLQLTSDLLLTQGDPRSQIKANDLPPQLPVIVCNPDMLFMHASHLPRFGHGSFVLCLEGIYKKLTGRNLEYDAILGKPSEASFRYAEHRLNNLSRALRLWKNINTMYMIGDNHEVDIVGGNKYHQYVNKSPDNNPAKIPDCRMLPEDADLGLQSVREVKSYLVKTGVYQDSNAVNTSSTENETNDIVHSHTDFNVTKDLLTPYKIFNDVNDAIDDIFELENV